jgi:hypothetical protein
MSTAGSMGGRRDRNVFVYRTSKTLIIYIYCIESTLTGEFRFNINTPLGWWTQVHCDRKQTCSLLDQWDMVWISEIAGSSQYIYWVGGGGGGGEGYLRGKWDESIRSNNLEAPTKPNMKYCRPLCSCDNLVFYRLPKPPTSHTFGSYFCVDSLAEEK